MSKQNNKKKATAKTSTQGVISKSAYQLLVRAKKGNAKLTKQQHVLMSQFETVSRNRSNEASQFRRQPSAPTYEPHTHRNKRTYEPYGPTTDRAVDVLVNHRAATLAYVHTLLNPAAEDDIGISILPGGFTPSSTVVQLRATSSFSANTFGNAWVRVYGSAERNESLESGVYEDGIYRRGPGRIVNPAEGNCIAIASQDDSNDAPPNFAQAVIGAGAPPLHRIDCPRTGLDTDDAEFRLVSAEMLVFPTQALLTAQGTGMMVRPAVWSEQISMNGTYEELYDKKRNEVHQAPLANWSPDDVFRQVYIPSRQEQLRYTDCLITQPALEAGLAWGAFAATGCTPGQTFRVEFIWNFEINSSTLTTSRNRIPSNKGFDVIAAMRPHLPPHIELDQTPKCARARRHRG
jgi:hypothetical protein